MEQVAGAADNRTDRERVRDAFKALCKQGYKARMNFGCCGSCAGAALDWSGPGVTYNRQNPFNGGSDDDSKEWLFYWGMKRDAGGGFVRDADGRRVYEKRPNVLYINWQSDASVIRAALEAEGLRTVHDGTVAMAIGVVSSDREVPMPSDEE